MLAQSGKPSASYSGIKGRQDYLAQVQQQQQKPQDALAQRQQHHKCSTALRLPTCIEAAAPQMQR